MKYFSVLLLIGFVGLAVFGVFGMSHENGQSHDMTPSNCIVATAKGVDCPKEAEPIDFVVFHIDTLKDFFLATFGESVISAFLLAFASLLFIGLAFFSLYFFRPPQLVFYRYRFRDSFFPSQKQQLTRWLALRENSPTPI